MILRTATRFDEENWFKTEIDNSVPSCEVTGELDGVPVEWELGGSSDLSPAQVTVVNNSEDFQCVYVVAFSEPYNSMLADYGEIPSGTYTMPLYKGALVLSTNGSGTVSVSGACEYDDSQLIITGDCTITIS